MYLSIYTVIQCLLTSCLSFVTMKHSYMKKSLLIIGDTDALISTINKDAHHEVVKTIYRELASVNADIYFPSAIIAETITTCQRRLKNPSLAEAMVTKLTSDLINVIPTDGEILQLAAAFFHPHGSK